MYILTNNAKEISEELFKLSRPNNNNGLMFGYIEKDGEFALEIDLDAEVLIHPLKDTTKLKELINYADEQKEQLDAYLDSVEIKQTEPEPPSGYVLGRFPFRNIVEGFTEMKDREWMVLNGWIIEDDNI